MHERDRPAPVYDESPVHDGRSSTVFGLLLTVVVAVLYWPVLSFQFVYDDGTLILRNPNIHSWDGVWHAFQGAMWSFDQWTADTGFYRPITAIVQTCLWMLFGDNPSAFHAFNLIVHLLTVFVVYRLSHTLGFSGYGAGLAATIIGVHPIAIQPVAWISAMSDGLSTLLVCIAFSLYVQHVRALSHRLSLALAWCLLLAAALTLERSWLLSPLFVVYAWFYGANQTTKMRIRLTLRASLMVGSALGFAISIRWLALESANLPTAVNWAALALTTPATAVQHVSHFAYPAQLSVAYKDALIPEVSWSLVGMPLTLLTAMAAVGGWFARRYAGPAGKAFALMALFLLLTGAAGGALTPGDLVHDRYVYSASLCCALWLGSMVPETLRRSSNTRMSILAGVLWIALLVGLHRDNLQVWTDNQTLYERAVLSAPHKPRYLLNLSNTLRRKQIKQPECALLKRAQAATTAGIPGGDIVKIGFSLGNCHRDAKRPALASEAYNGAFRASGNRFFPALENDVLSWLSASQPDQAVKAAKMLTEAAPRYARAWHLLGVSAATRADWSTAEAAFSRALKLDPRDKASRAYLAQVQREAKLAK